MRRTIPISKIPALCAAFWALAFLPVASWADPPETPTPPEETEKKSDEKRVGPPARKDGKDGKAGAADPIPRLPADELPARTRQRPDPAKEQFEKSSVYVDVSEKAERSDGSVYVPETTVVRNYLAEYFRRAGYRVTDTPEEAEYAIEGRFETHFDQEILFKERLLGWKYVGEAHLKIREASGDELFAIDLPEVDRVNAKSEQSAIWDIRRFVAHLIYTELFRSRAPFTEKPIVDLLETLVADPFTVVEPLTGEQVVERLADIGLPAVPYLIDALADMRVAQVEMQYPGLEKVEDLKVYHVADKALEEVFQKVSRMGVKTPDKHRFIIIRGWENEWRRFCPAFRESPEAKRTSLSRRSPGAVRDPKAANPNVREFRVGADEFTGEPAPTKDKPAPPKKQ